MAMQYASSTPTLEEEPDSSWPVAEHPKPSPKLYSVRKLILGSASRVIYLGLVTFIGLFLTPFTVRTLGAEQFGLWALANAFIGYYSILDLGLSGAVFTHMSHALGARDAQAGSRIYSTGLVMFAAAGGIVLIITLFLAAVMPQISHAHNIGLILLICGTLAAISFPMRAPYGVLNAGSHFEVTSWINIFAAVIRTGATVYVLLHGYGVVGLALAQLFASIPGYICVLIAVHIKYPFIRFHIRNAWDRVTARKLSKFALPVLVGQIADRLRLQSDALIVSFAIGLTAVAHYNVATTLVMYYTDGVMALVGVITPIIAMQHSAGDSAGMLRSFFAGTRASIVIGAFAGFGIIAIGHAFIARWMGNIFLDAYPVLILLTVAMFFDLWQSTGVSSLYATMNQKSYARINLLEAGMNVVLSFMFVHRYGMLGVAMGTLIPGICVRAVVQPWIVQKKLGISMKHYLLSSGRTLLKCFVCLIAPGFVVMRWLRADYLSILTTSLLCLLLFAFPMWIWEFQGVGYQRVRAMLRGHLLNISGEPT
ncbi:MAG: oligosaccharide flippase family protein [Granulicella sp.]